MFNQSTARKSDQSEVAISGRLANQKPGKKNLKGGYRKKQPIDTKSSFYKKQRRETHTSFDMSRKAKDQTKDQTKSLNIPFTLTQRGLVQEAIAVAKVQTQALNIPVKVPLGGGRYAELTEWNGTKRVDLRFWETDTIPTKVWGQLVVVTVDSLVLCHGIGGRFDRSSERRRTRGLEISSGRRRLLHHQSPSTDNSYQEALRP